MPRTTAEAVAGIIEIDEEIDLTPFIETADALVTEVCEPVTSYDASRLELIERWLAAHFYAVRDPRTTSESAGVSASFESKVDLGLNLTRYGQMALTLDTAGGLSNLLNNTSGKGRRRVGVYWGGIPQQGDQTYDS